MMMLLRRGDEMLRRVMMRGRSMKFVDSTDESLLAYYESVRRQVAADIRLSARHRLLGASVKRYAEELQAEMRRRRLGFQPIEWP